MSTSGVRDPRYSQARFAALARLRSLYAGTYARLLAQEQARLGLRPARPPAPKGRPPCGTIEAFRWHERHREPTDDACRMANVTHRGRAYARVREQLRRLHPEEFRTLQDKELGKEPATTSQETKRRQRDRARARALSQLQQRHWDEFRRLLDTERGRS